MPEVVALSHADHSVVRMYQIERLLREPVVAAVVGHLEHLHTAQVPRSGDAGERGMLGIACEQRVESAPAHPKHDARVVGAELLPRFPGRPHHIHGGGAEPPRIPRRDAPHRLRPHHPRHDAVRRGEPLGDDTGDRSPADARHATQAPDPSGVIVVRMREHQHIHSTHAFARQRAPEHGSIRAGVHEHGPAAITYEDGVALADVEHGDRHLP